jgi:pentatricopeptide repeat protein
MQLHPDAISYNAVIGACASAGRWKEALTVLDECYNEEGVEPNIYIYTNAIRACAKGGNTQKALSLLQVVKDKGLAVDSYCYTAVIDGMLCIRLAAYAVVVVCALFGFFFLLFSLDSCFVLFCFVWFHKFNHNHHFQRAPRETNGKRRWNSLTKWKPRVSNQPR